MSDSSILHRFSARTGSETLARVHEDELCDDLGCFGWLRGVRERSIMLELRKKNGNILAVGYGWMDRAEFDPSEGITLHLAGQRVLIRGRNLNAEVRPLVRLFEGITRHRVPWIQEADKPGVLESDARTVVIDGLVWDPR